MEVLKVWGFKGLDFKNHLNVVLYCVFETLLVLKYFICVLFPNEYVFTVGFIRISIICYGCILFCALSFSVSQFNVVLM